MSFDALGKLLEAQESAQATAAGAALLGTFDQILASLIGPSLTERLLGNLYATSPQDTKHDD